MPGGLCVYICSLCLLKKVCPWFKMRWMEDGSGCIRPRACFWSSATSLGTLQLRKNSLVRSVFLLRLAGEVAPGITRVCCSSLLLSMIIGQVSSIPRPRRSGQHSLLGYLRLGGGTSGSYGGNAASRGVGCHSPYLSTVTGTLAR